jgi:hypothetical protein
MGVYRDYMRGHSDRPNPHDTISKFTYELDSHIGEQKIIKGFKSIFEKTIPSRESLELLIEQDVFQSEVFSQLSLFPGPKQSQ